MKEVGKAPGRSKDATLRMLKKELGRFYLGEIDRERIVKFGRARRALAQRPSGSTSERSG